MYLSQNKFITQNILYSVLSLAYFYKTFAILRRVTPRLPPAIARAGTAPLCHNGWNRKGNDETIICHLYIYKMN